MIKLSDIIKSGGNAKINRFINRYVLSKKEKKDIVDKIKNNKHSSSGNVIKHVPKYYIIKDGVSDDIREAITAYGSTAKVERNGKYYITIIMGAVDNHSYNTVGISFNPLYFKPDDEGDMLYIDSLEDFYIQMSGSDAEILQCVERITEEEYYKID